MRLTRTQTSHGTTFFLVETEENPKTHQVRGLVINMQTHTINRVKSVPVLLKTGAWRAVAASDPTLGELTRLVPALRPFRGIEVQLKTGITAWVRWRQWSSEDPAAQRLLTETTCHLTVPAYEPDGDYFLAVQAVAALGGRVLDPPRSVLSLGDEAY